MCAVHGCDRADVVRCKAVAFMDAHDLEGGVIILYGYSNLGETKARQMQAGDAWLAVQAAEIPFLRSSEHEILDPESNILNAEPSTPRGSNACSP